MPQRRDEIRAGIAVRTGWRASYLRELPLSATRPQWRRCISALDPPLPQPPRLECAACWIVRKNSPVLRSREPPDSHSMLWQSLRARVLWLPRSPESHAAPFVRNSCVRSDDGLARCSNLRLLTCRASLIVPVFCHYRWIAHDLRTIIPVRAKAEVLSYRAPGSRCRCRADK